MFNGRGFLAAPFAFLALTLLSCQSGDTPPPSMSPAIAKPGAVAVDALERREQLIEANALHLCPKYSRIGSSGVLDSVLADDDYQLDERYIAISARFRQLGASCLGGDDVSCNEIQQYALAWARTSKLQGPRGNENTALFMNETLSINMRLLSPMIAALGVAEQLHPLARADRNILEQWLKRKVDEYNDGMRHLGRYEGGRDGTTVRRAAHNHAMQWSIAAMSYGAWANNTSYFKIGIDQWYITLNSMREDGSLPIETRRGARALYYQGRAISALMQLAERAEVQGIDLYSSAPSPNKTVHHAVEFMINALEEPDLVLKYARTNFVPGTSASYKIQDLGGSFNTLGWLAPYVSQFPDHANSKRLLIRQKYNHSEPSNYLTIQLDRAVRTFGESSEWIGVDATCFYSDPELR